jgi:hypothetical protein
MSSPTRGPVRRRQRSARVAVACLLLTIGVLAVVGGALSESWMVLTVAAAVGVGMGALATRITYLEVLQSRRDAATGRAELAQEYRSLTAARTDENALFVADMTGRITRHEATITRLEKRLVEVTAELIEAHKQHELALERAHRAEEDGGRLATQLAEAEERATLSTLRVAELEQERDVLVAEWQAAENLRKHA